MARAPLAIGRDLALAPTRAILLGTYAYFCDFHHTTQGALVVLGSAQS